MKRHDDEAGSKYPTDKVDGATSESKKAPTQIYNHKTSRWVDANGKIGMQVRLSAMSETMVEEQRKHNITECEGDMVGEDWLRIRVKLRKKTPAEHVSSALFHERQVPLVNRGFAFGGNTGGAYMLLNNGAAGGSSSSVFTFGARTEDKPPVSAPTVRSKKDAVMKDSVKVKQKDKVKLDGFGLLIRAVEKKEIQYTGLTLEFDNIDCNALNDSAEEIGEGGDNDESDSD